MGVGAGTAVVTGAGVVGGAEVVAFVVTVAFLTDFFDALGAGFLVDTFLIAARVDEEVTTVTTVISTTSAKRALLRGKDQQVFAKTGERMLDSNSK